MTFSQPALVDVDDLQLRTVMPGGNTDIGHVGNREVEIAMFVCNVQLMYMQQAFSRPVLCVQSLERLEYFDPLPCRPRNRVQLLTADRLPVSRAHKNRKRRVCDMLASGVATKFVDDVVQSRAQVMDAVACREADVVGRLLRESDPK